MSPETLEDSPKELEEGAAQSWPLITWDCRQWTKRAPSRELLTDSGNMPSIERVTTAGVLRRALHRICIKRAPSKKSVEPSNQRPKIKQTCADLATKYATFQRSDDIEQDDRGIWTVPRHNHVAWFPNLKGKFVVDT